MKASRLNAAYIQRHCGITACVFEEVTSTNEIVKSYGRQGAPAWTMAVAASQTAGRGRGERSFFSPDGTGVYLSILLRPESDLPPAGITATAAVAAIDAMEELGARSLGIKWLNDIYRNGKKVSGILAEAVESENGRFAVLGIGINLLPPRGGFPSEIADRAGALFDDTKERFLRERMAIAFFEHLEKRLRDPSGVYTAYRGRLLALGKTVQYNGANATVTDLLPDFRLVLTMEDGAVRYLDSGEISLNLS